MAKYKIYLPVNFKGELSLSLISDALDRKGPTIFNVISPALNYCYAIYERTTNGQLLYTLYYETYKKEDDLAFLIEIKRVSLFEEILLIGYKEDKEICLWDTTKWYGAAYRKHKGISSSNIYTTIKELM